MQLSNRPIQAIQAARGVEVEEYSTTLQMMAFCLYIASRLLPQAMQLCYRKSEVNNHNVRNISAFELAI